MSILNISLVLIFTIAAFWSVFVVCPVLFASNYNIMLNRWEKTSALHQLLGFIFTMLTILILIYIGLFDITLTPFGKIVMLPFLFITFSFFVIYGRSRIQ